MEESTDKQLLRQIRRWIILFIAALVLSGVTAFPLETELSFLIRHMGYLPSAMQQWLVRVEMALHATDLQFAFLAYGTDWLAFAHIIIATVFIGPYKDPIKNIWIIQWGMLACLLVVPLALVAGQLRGIPFYWQLIDCSFGVFGILPLYLCYQKIKRLEKMIKSSF